MLARFGRRAWRGAVLARRERFSSGERPDGAARFAKLLEKHNARGEHEECAAVFKAAITGGPTMSDAAVHAAMEAYCWLRRPSTAKGLLPLIEHRTKATTSFKSLDILLSGYSRADRLDAVEGILFEWLSRAGAPTSAPPLLAALGLSRRAKSSQDLERVLSLESLMQAPGPRLVLPSLAAWAAVSKMYAGRYAWERCEAILKAHEPAASAAAATPPADAANLARLYHHCVRALCDAGLFARALEVIARLRALPALREHVGHGHLLTHLLKFFRHREGVRVDKAQLDVILSATDDDEGGAREGLSAAFVSLLCLRGRAREAEEVVRQAAERRELRPSCVAMVINSYAKAGQWGEAEDLFWALRSHIPLSSPQGRRAYHHVCEALAQARQTQGLAHFMQRNQGGAN